MKRIKADDLHKKWMKNPEYRREYEALEEEFALRSEEHTSELQSH